MKKTTLIACLVLLLTAALGYGQGTFIYDQQSSDESYIGSGAAPVQPNQPFGQSFTPALSSLNFVRLYLFDAVADGQGASIRITLLSGSVSGAVLGSTDPISVAEGFSGAADFVFPMSIAVTSGTQYFFRPEVISGGVFSVAAYNTFGYTGGNAYYSGTATPGIDLWFREGIYNAPEPSAASLFLASIALIALKRRTGYSES